MRPSSQKHASTATAIAATMFPGAGGSDETKQAHFAKAAAKFQDVDDHLEGRAHLLESFSVADLYLTFLNRAPDPGGDEPRPFP